jgi:hypothetical protein
VVPLNYYDKASRFVAKLDSVEFLSWLFGVPTNTFVFRDWLDTRDIPFPGEPDRTCDTVAHLEDVAAHGVPWAVAVEFQTQPDPTMFGRMLGYLSGLWLNRKPDVERGSRFHLGAAVVNLTGSGSASREMNWPAVGLQAQLKIVERNVEHESAEELITGIESGRWSRCLLPWVPLMSGAEKPDIIGRWKGLAQVEPDPRRKAQFATIAILFATKAGRKRVWQEQLEGWNVEENEYVNEWIAVGEKRGIAIGEARGKEIGEARGKEIGEVQEARATILRLGTKKFGSAPEGIEAIVQAIQDRARLERIIDHILDATSWPDLVATG